MSRTQIPHTLQQFLKTLLRSGILSADEGRSFVHGLSPELRAGDVKALTRELVRQNKLTQFQANLVAGGDADRLTFGDYVLLDKIGAGGMGQVFKAKNRRMDRIVALKLLPSSGAKSPIAVARFQREVKVTARLDHPYIVAAYHAGKVADNYFLETQYIHGRDLKTQIDWHGRLSVADAVRYTLQAAEGLHHAHQHRVIHRDIKPANLLVDRNTNTVKILDWGLARIIGEVGPPLGDDASGASQSGRLTLPDQLLGTADYMSPEQSEETHNADVPSDIYSLACTLYYLLTGAPPFQGDTVYQVLVAHRTAPVPSLRTNREDVPEQLDHILRTMMAKRPQDRYPSMAEVMPPLEAVLKEAPAASPPNSGGSRPGTRTTLDAADVCRDLLEGAINERDGDALHSRGDHPFEGRDKTQTSRRELTAADDPGVTVATECPTENAEYTPSSSDDTRMLSTTDETSQDEQSEPDCQRRETGLRQLVGQTTGLQSGFAGLLKNDGKSSIWYNYQGQKVPQFHLRQRTAGETIEWETPPVVVDSKNARANFVFAGALGSFSEPKTEGFTFLVNDREVLDFDVTRQETCWHSGNRVESRESSRVESRELRVESQPSTLNPQPSTVVLLFSPKWTSDEDAAGFFYVSVSGNLVTPGDPCRFAVRAKGTGSRRWFSLCPAPDAVKLQALES